MTADFTSFPDMLDELLGQLTSSSMLRSGDVPDIDLYMDQVTSFMDSHLGSFHSSSEPEKLLTKTMINNYTKNKLLPPPNKKKYSRDHLLLLTMIYYLKNIMSLQDIQALFSPLVEDVKAKSPEAKAKAAKADSKAAKAESKVAKAESKAAKGDSKVAKADAKAKKADTKEAAGSDENEAAASATLSGASSAAGLPDIRTVYDELAALAEGNRDTITASVEHYRQAALSAFADAPQEDQKFLQFFTLISLLCYDASVKKEIIEHLIQELME